MKISVITINYNNFDGLKMTVESVERQTKRELVEFLVIDGGSKDGAKEYLEENSEKFAYWVSEPDKGVYNAMNKGIDRATGDYCIFMNSGDIFYSETVIEGFSARCDGSDIVCGGTITDKHKPAPKEITLDVLFNSSICHQCAFIKMDLMKKHHYDESLRIVSDRKFFVQAFILDNCSYQPIDVDVVKYDISGLSAVNPVPSRLEYAKVLEELIPERIRIDYGRKKDGDLYGDSAFNKMFAEIGIRNYRGIVYRLVHSFLSIVSIFRKSASFINNYPKSL